VGAGGATQSDGDIAADVRLKASGRERSRVQPGQRVARGRLGAPLLGHEALITWVAFSPDGAFLASSSQDGTVRIWDPATGAQLRTLV
jgi:WD40 repeat protein